eukprot:3943497-Prymnesium_polylepis.3
MLCLHANRWPCLPSEPISSFHQTPLTNAFVTPSCPELYAPPVSETHACACAEVRFVSTLEARRSLSLIASSLRGSRTFAVRDRSSPAPNE